MPPSSGKRYNISSYQVAAKNDRTVLEYHSGIFPESVQPFRVYNIGREPVWAEAKYGRAGKWMGGIVGYTVEPGHEQILDIGDRLYYRTGIYLQNNNDNRVLVHCGHKNNQYPWYDKLEGSWELKIDINAIAKKLVVFGVSKIPKVGEVLSSLIEFFWPDTEEPSIWDQIKDQVKDLVDTKTNEAIRGILGGDIRHIKERILLLKQDLKRHQNVDAHFMNIAEDLIGFEKKFALAKEDNSSYGEINYFILPLYSTMVTLKLAFYEFGILNQEDIGLTHEHVQRLKDYSERLVNGPEGAVHHIIEVLNERLLHELNTCNPDHVFDALATVRTFCALNGTEYLAYWKDLLIHPGAEKKPYNDAISYSKVFGRPTPIQARQIVPVDPEQPLTPKLIDGKRNKIDGVDVWMWRINNGRGKPKIGGLKVYFENGDTYEMGGWSSEKHYIYFKGAVCTRLSAWGDGALDGLEFAFSDGRVISVGTKSEAHGIQESFELENHHIAGIYLGNDVGGLGGQAANITVSYQLTPEQ
ncbi:hypothetical protein JTB14_031166 [Gonioctena quinquepunctata]|nr:hypothetical protein JTB14_031166 [Gonioctena quinquepunctata]